jgi:ubiquinone/menaquinone biosynthesis C-methylase UbiE
MVADEDSTHPLFARFYAWISPRMERAGMAPLRQALLEGLRGEVIEVGAGNGLTFPHYPKSVTRLVAVEPDQYLRRLAQEAAADAPVPVEVVDGHAENIPAADGAFHAGVVSLVLCSVSDPEKAVDELARVVRPGGQVRFLEHVRAATAGAARVQRLLDATVWPRLGGGCHTSRDPVATFERAGFTLDSLTRMRFPDGPVTLPTTPHVLGVATTPAREDVS